MSYVIAEDGGQRQHREWLSRMLNTTTGPVRIATAYITDRDLLFGARTQRVRILTSLYRMDIVSGATSLETLRCLIEAGVRCRCLSEGPRLHAKVYMFGKKYAVVTSANLTRNALDTNIEVGVQLAGKSVDELIAWFDKFWATARRLDLPELSRWEQGTWELRQEYERLRMKARGKPTLPNEASPSLRSRGALRDLSEKASRTFVCNTNRRWSSDAEELMFRMGYAAVWEDFRYPSHMKRVEPNDAIFMFAKGVGIIGVGRAKAECEILKVGANNRIADGFDAAEWRIPVDWLAWVEDDADACPCRSQTQASWM